MCFVPITFWTVWLLLQSTMLLQFPRLSRNLQIRMLSYGVWTSTRQSTSTHLVSPEAKAAYPSRAKATIQHQQPRHRRSSQLHPSGGQDQFRSTLRVHSLRRNQREQLLAPRPNLQRRKPLHPSSYPSESRRPAAEVQGTHQGDRAYNQKHRAYRPLLHGSHNQHGSWAERIRWRSEKHRIQLLSQRRKNNSSVPEPGLQAFRRFSGLSRGFDS